MSAHIRAYLRDLCGVVGQLDAGAIDQLVRLLLRVRAAEGRVFLLGLGGSAANASHAANDLRCRAGLEAYSATDNVAELSARINDAGWEQAFVGWLQGSHLAARDAVCVLSVGGGHPAGCVSAPIVQALTYARQVGAHICGIVGRDGGVTAQVAEVCVRVPVVNTAYITEYSEVAQAMVWHAVAADPRWQEGA